MHVCMFTGRPSVSSVSIKREYIAGAYGVDLSKESFCPNRTNKPESERCHVANFDLEHWWRGIPGQFQALSQFLWHFKTHSKPNTTSGKFKQGQRNERIIQEKYQEAFFVRRRHLQPRLGMQGRHSSPKDGMVLSAPQGQTFLGTACPKPTCITCPSARSLPQASLMAK